MNIPKELKYTKDHEWIKVEGNMATIGITDFAQSQLGDVVFVDLPAVDDEITAGKEFGAIESVKAVSDIYAPLSGTIAEVNELLADAPETVNQDAFGDGWIIKIVMKDENELSDLLDSAEYEKVCEEEAH